ncbi:MAG: NAD(P)H-dependent glycerol-3-phosphate dehydrogenase [Planctomycetota bacterium]|jgi:glycerol-3-phosphate dehydrogenase (NAD(P)+)
MADEIFYIVVGDGQMGLVLAQLLKEVTPGARVVLWGHVREEIEELNRTRRSPRLDGFELHPDIETIWEVERAAGIDFECCVSAVPTQFLRGVWERFAGVIEGGCPIVSVSKGVEIGTGMFPSRIIVDVLGDRAGAHQLVTLSGPTIATEMVVKRPTTMLSSCSDDAVAQRVQRMFSSPWTRIYTTTDHAGVELAGAVKNVIAIAAGIVDGMGLGYNAKSALLSRGLAEMARLGVALGAQAETFFGIAGVGDLATTCFCPHGRNRSCGEALGRGETLDDYLARTISVVEGVATTRAVLALADERGVEMPIARSVGAVLFEGLAVRDAIAALMERPLRAESIGS